MLLHDAPSFKMPKKCSEVFLFRAPPTARPTNEAVEAADPAAAAADPLLLAMEDGRSTVRLAATATTSAAAAAAFSLVSYSRWQSLAAKAAAGERASEGASAKSADFDTFTT